MFWAKSVRIYSKQNSGFCKVRVELKLEIRHCEEVRRSNLVSKVDCRTSFAMTKTEYTLELVSHDPSVIFN